MPTPATDQPRGVKRRTLPLGRLVSATRQQLGSESRRAGDRIMLLLERRNALARLSRAAEKHETPAAKAARRGPIGRGGHPLSDEHRDALEEIFELEEMRAFGSLIRSSTNAFALSVGGVLEDRYLEMYNAGGKAAVQILGARGSFNLRNGFILEALADRANLLSKGFGDELFDRLRTVVAEEFFISGRGPRDVAASLRDEFSFLTQERAELIARTETLAITSEAQFTVYKASGVERKRWLCVDGDTRVSGVGVTHVARRLHTGKMVELRTASGRVVTVTGDHRVLTRRGWLAAELLNEGDDIVCYKGGMESSAPWTREVPDIDNMPPKIEQVFNAAYKRATSMRMVRRVVDFDSEGRCREVEVVPINSELMRSLYPLGAEGFGKGLFKLTDVGIDELFTGSHLSSGFRGHLASSVRGPSSGNATLLDFDRVLGGSESTSFRLRTDMHSSHVKHAGNQLLGASPTHGEFPEGSPLSILFDYDQCVAVNIRSASTHVYDYTTETGWMVANSLVVHNSTLDGRERPAHFKLHGQVRAIDEPYEVEDEDETFLIMMPGDTNADPRMTMGCRCDEEPIVTDEQLESDAPVWRGDIDPDEFARDREAA